MRHPRPFRAAAALAVPLLAAACTDRLPTIDPPGGEAAQARLECRATVRPAALACVRADASTGAALGDRMMGGQDVYVKLASRNTAYDGGTREFTADVSLENLTQYAFSGAKVFFASEPVGTGGTVTVNADSVDTFTAPDQDYYDYPEPLEPYQVSSWKTWSFTLDSGVTSFTFTVYVDALGVVSTGPLHDAEWAGGSSGDWQTAANWLGGAVPGASSVVFIPSDSLFGGAHPVLSADAEAAHLRVGGGTTLALGGHTLTVGGNVDAAGTVSGGTLRMTGTGAYLRGTVDALEVQGDAALQGATQTTGAVAVSGSLTAADQTLTITLP